MDYHAGNIYAVELSGMLLGGDQRIALRITERALSWDRRVDLFQHERVYFELLGSAIVPDPINLYGQSPVPGTRNLSQRDVYMEARFAALDKIIEKSSEQALRKGVRRKFPERRFQSTGHTTSASVRLLPYDLSQRLIPLLAEVEKSQKAIAPELALIPFSPSHR